MHVCPCIDSHATYAFQDDGEDVNLRKAILIDDFKRRIKEIDEAENERGKDEIEKMHWSYPRR
jgi:hypothetical protein